MAKAKTPREMDKSYKRSFNLKAGFASFLLSCSLGMQAYHDNFREEAQKDPEGLCSSYYDGNRDEVLKDHEGKGFEDKEEYVDSCSSSLRNIPEKSPLSTFFGQLSLGAASLAAFSLMGWRNHRKKYPELNSSSPDNE